MPGPCIGSCREKGEGKGEDKGEEEGGERGEGRGAGREVGRGVCACARFGTRTRLRIVELSFSKALLMEEVVVLERPIPPGETRVASNSPSDALTASYGKPRWRRRRWRTACTMT